MGLTPFARVHLRNTYTSAFSFTRPKDPTVIIYDLMKDMKFMPDEVTTLDGAICYITGKVQQLIDMRDSIVTTFVILVDRKPPPVKRMVTHAKRYKNKGVMRAKNGPYLPTSLTSLIPTPWIQFAGSYKNLQREFYPRLLNAFLDNLHICLRPTQTLILHGFPGYIELVTTFSKDVYKHGSNERGQVEVIHQWKETTELPITKKQELDDPDLYNRIFYLKHNPPSPQHPNGWLESREWTEAKNDISESDGAMFFYDHWFQNDTIMFVCNDGDVFAYGLLYACERVTMSNTWRNKHIVCMPYKSKQNLDLFEEGKAPKYEYVDLNLLYMGVQEDPVFKRAGVQHHIATMVFLLIIAGSDFFKDYMKGLGAENVLWRVFFSRLSVFSHMVQMSRGVIPDTRTPRTVVLDEECFILFGFYCYLQRFGNNARKKAGLDLDDTDHLTHADLQVVCNATKKAQENAEYQLPSQNQFRLWARQILWNQMYYTNTPLGNEHSPNPFETWRGLPFYPYVLNPKTGKPEMVTVVSAYSKPVDQVFQVNMYASKKRLRSTRPISVEEASKQKKQAIQDLTSVKK